MTDQDARPEKPEWNLTQCLDELKRRELPFAGWVVWDDLVTSWGKTMFGSLEDLFDRACSTWRDRTDLYVNSANEICYDYGYIMTVPEGTYAWKTPQAVAWGMTEREMRDGEYHVDEP